MAAVLEQREEEDKKSRGNEEVKVTATGFWFHLGAKTKIHVNH